MMKILKYLQTMKRASGNGVFFPKDAGGRAAPLGTFEAKTKGSIWKRLTQEHQWFRMSKHLLPMTGIDQKLSILHLTDVHISKDNKWLDQLCQKIKPLTPDLVAITGDVLTKGWQRGAIDKFLSAIPKAPLGSFAVMGNWEYWTSAPPDKWRKILSAHGIELLVDQHKSIGGIQIAGTDDLLAGKPKISEFLKRLSDEPTIVLTHSPAIFPQLAGTPIQLILAGHAHGGQIRPPLIGAFWVPRGTDAYIAGWYKKNGSHLFISRGIGWSVAPIRMWCPPEIAWIDIIPAKKL